jgi:hypothetical protein
MVIDSNKTYKNLKKKGFTDAEGDHKYLELFHKGKFIARTKISHGGAHDTDEGLINKMADQCKLNKQDFINLAKCPLSKEKYFEKLENAGLME